MIRHAHSTASDPQAAATDLRDQLGAGEDTVAQWMHHWIAAGFTALERILREGGVAGACCFGDEPTLVDCCLVPQVFNAERFDCDLSPFPSIRRIAEHCRSLDAFAAAAPERQPDAGDS